MRAPLQSFFIFSLCRCAKFSNFVATDFARVENCIATTASSAVVQSRYSFEYNNSRIGTNFRYDNYFPAVIVNIGTVADIEATVKCAKEAHFELGVMNGGHSFEGMSCTQGVLLNMNNFSGVLEFDITSVIPHIKVQSGIRLARLYGIIIELTEKSEQKYILGAGTCPTVGVTGHVLCGGYGYLGRNLGLTSDQVMEMEIMLSNGTVVSASNEMNRDLFWALRGGCSSSFGIVTSIAFRLYPLPYPNVTVIELPLLLYSGLNVSINAALWWQIWSSVLVTKECSSTLTFEPYGMAIRALCTASLQQSMAWTLQDFISGLSAAFTEKDIRHSYKEVSMFDAIVWWTSDSSLTTLQDFLAVDSLPPLTSRSRSRRKAKSLLVPQILSRETVAELITYRTAGLVRENQIRGGRAGGCGGGCPASSYSCGLNQIEWKAYGGVNSATGSLYTDTNSPLLRGSLFEMHFGSSYSCDMDSAADGGNTSWVGGDDHTICQEDDERLVNCVNSIGGKIIFNI